MEEIYNLIRLKFTAGIGDILCRRLLGAFGSATAVIRASRPSISRVPGVGPKVYDALHAFKSFDLVEKEIRFMHGSGVRCISILDEAYPEKLSYCYDAPFLIFATGTLSFSRRKIISIVGARAATMYGKEITAAFVQGLAGFNPVIASGLAYGIDIAAHKAAIDCGLETAAVVAHGLHTIYPASHRSHASHIAASGWLVSEHPSTVNADKENFPKRNRIIAGMADATIVIEASAKGGALITARLAGAYNRDVFAVPGRIGDPYSAGCNLLIKTNEAQLLESAAEMAAHLGWDQRPLKREAIQKQIFIELSEDEERLVTILSDKKEAPVDLLSLCADFSASKTSALLLSLEMKGAVRTLPGKVYTLS